MKLLLMLNVIFCFSFLQSQNSQTNDDIIIGPSYSDKVFMNMDSSKVIGLYNSEQIKVESSYNPLSGNTESHINITYDSKNKMDVEVYSGKIYRIRVWGSRFITDKGIRIGDKFSKIKSQYKNYKILEGEEMGAPYFTTQEGLSFELSIEECWKNNTFDTNDLEKYVDDNSKVCSILIWEK